MVKSVGRPHPSAVGSHRTELFFTNDDGLFLFRGTQQQMSKMKEYETVKDRNKMLNFTSSYAGFCCRHERDVAAASAQRRP